MSHEKCPNCGGPIKESLLKSTYLLRDIENALIEEFVTHEPGHFCSKCGEENLNKAKSLLNKAITDARQEIIDYMALIPIVTTHSPYGWEYDVCGIVTGQAVMGTGAFTEIAASWTDFFGAQSGAYNDKIKHGENVCKGLLRSQAVKMDANAIIATDIDYSEMGAAKGMIMVCMAGTAVRVRNKEQVFAGSDTGKISQITDLTAKVQEWEERNRRLIVPI